MNCLSLLHNFVAYLCRTCKLQRLIYLTPKRWNIDTNGFTTAYKIKCHSRVFLTMNFSPGNKNKTMLKRFMLNTYLKEESFFQSQFNVTISVLVKNILTLANTIAAKIQIWHLSFIRSDFCTKPNCREVPFFLENANKIDFCAKWWQVFGHQGHDFASMTFCEGQNCAKTTLELWNIEVNIRLKLATVNVFLVGP